MNRKLLWGTLLLVLVAGCKREVPEGEVRHPWLGQVTLFAAPKDTLDLEVSAYREVTSDGQHLIGRVAAGRIGSRQHVYIVDDENKTIHIYDLQGTWWKSVGGPGEGPAEFRRPAQIRWIGRDTLAVLDGGRGILKLFRVQDTTMVYLRDLQLFPGVADFCVLQSRLYVRGSDGQLTHYVHVYDLTGRRLQSFGRIPEGGYRDELVRVYVARGRIACLEAAHLIITASDILPVVTAFRTDGTLLWEYRLPDFTPLKIHIPEPGAVILGVHEDYDAVVTLNPFLNGVLLQIAHLSNRMIRNFKTYYINTTGDLHPVKTKGVLQKNILLDIKNTKIIGSNNFPEPKISFGTIRAETGRQS